MHKAILQNTMSGMFIRLPYPDIDPILIQLGPFPIRWYALAYIGGIALAWWLMGRMIARPELWTAPQNHEEKTGREEKAGNREKMGSGGGKGLGKKSRKATRASSGTSSEAGGHLTDGPPLTKLQLDDLMFWGTLGVILGGRVGYILFYETALLWTAWPPLGVGWGDGILKTVIGWLPFPPALMVWRGGMSFHGGALGVVLLVCLFCRRHKISPLGAGDMGAIVIPIGLGFGRLANFINGELYGRAADVPWAMVFPTDPLQIPRHPSQLYEAGLEGLLLFVILAIAAYRYRILRYRGVATGILAAGYGTARLFVEFFREPDASEIFGLTRGMALSLPMIGGGAYLIYRQVRAQRAGTRGHQAGDRQKGSRP